MGGHGALTIGLRNANEWRSVSAFAPISSTRESKWGREALTAYLGEDEATWADYDATRLAGTVSVKPSAPILVDQGLADQFLAQELYPDEFESACAAAGIDLEMRRHEGYDHGYYFIATFIEDHLRHHARILSG